MQHSRPLFEVKQPDADQSREEEYEEVSGSSYYEEEELPGAADGSSKAPAKQAEASAIDDLLQITLTDLSTQQPASHDIHKNGSAHLAPDATASFLAEQFAQFGLKLT